MRLLLKTLSRNEVLAADALNVLNQFDQHDPSNLDIQKIATTATEFSPSRVKIFTVDGSLLAEDSTLEDALFPDKLRLFKVEQSFGPRNQPLGFVQMELADHAGVVELLVLECVADLMEIVILRSKVGLKVTEAKDSTDLNFDSRDAIQNLLNPRSSTEIITQSIRNLGIRTSYPHRVFVIDTMQPRKTVESLLSKNGDNTIVFSWVNNLLVGICNITSNLLETRSFSDELRLGVGSAAEFEDLPSSYEQALTALEFTNTFTPLSKVAHWDDIGTFSTLATLAPEQISKSLDVQALMELSKTEAGLSDLTALEALCLTGSIRAAANILYLHHSSTTRRIHRLEETLGFPVSDPAFRGRAHAALLGWRITIGNETVARKSKIKVVGE